MTSPHRVRDLRPLAADEPAYGVGIRITVRVLLYSHVGLGAAYPLIGLDALWPLVALGVGAALGCLTIVDIATR